MNYISYIKLILSRDITSIIFDYLTVNKSMTNKLLNITMSEMMFYGGSTYKHSLRNYIRDKGTKNWFYYEFVKNGKYLHL
jgi:hypothetical protein